MIVNSKVKFAVWALWLSLSPLLLWITYLTTGPSISGREMDVASFLLLMALVALIPIIVNETPIFFTEGVALAVFLAFGLFVEIILVQFALIVLLVKIRVSRRDLIRIPTNSLMFLLVSIIAGGVYYLLGGTTGGVDITSTSFLIPIIGYEISKFFANHSILVLIRRLVYKRKDQLISRDLIWEAGTTLIHFPVGIVLYLLYVEMGIIALFYVGIPLVSLSLILKLYYSSQKINYYLQKASEIGHQLAGRMQVDEVLDLFIEKLSSMLPVDYAYVLDVTPDGKLKLVRYLENGEEKSHNLDHFNGFGTLVWQSRKAVMFNSKREIKQNVAKNLPDSVQSVIGVPVVRNKQAVGIIILASNKKKAYEKYQLMIVDLLSSYLAVATENAKNYEETKRKSERCPLTKLYNYRYFERVLEQEFNSLKKNENVKPLSLILLDIDHFKKINDTYGHQSGNEVLCELADHLLHLVGEKGTVARYGGEEFVILLPNMDKLGCYAFAEDLRKSIEDKVFSIHDDLNHGNEIFVNITASIGFATAPYDSETTMDLIRHADRAMYIGAKQAGRNKVAQYVK
ncbi:sensor domain-containing diguanylate cyclase [Bacillus timonensis]|nr:sensor domain-containing diguanylate cyclase [Bacillus timonensis]